MLEILKAIFLGIIEGITEWLPISSTGHLILAEEFVKLNASESFKSMFNVVIQLGAIMAVVVIFFDKLNPFDGKKSYGEKRSTWRLWVKVLIASIPAGIIGIKFDDWFEAHFYNFVSVALMLILYGFAFIYVEKWAKSQTPTVTSLNKMPYLFAFYIGVFQVLALMPGTSRSGVTILGAIILGASRYVAAEFTFFLAIPAMFGGSAIKVLKFIKNGEVLSGQEFLVLLIASLTAFVVSVVVIKFLMDYIKKHDFTIFGKYRIVLGLILLVYAAIKFILGLF
ncbi:undecaprenyl-diphosphate phosphatase [Streptococcaceae bacterium ESL0729]|nr:undecaprenyl-diphosphate phosphatase [Streptococcaceae bacterium ESL0729]